MIDASTEGTVTEGAFGGSKRCALRGIHVIGKKMG